ncbi:MAG: lytic transglycosylase domain-containing protein [Yoonia sp.]|nr:lytic transglycosylase domain-containing protein [Yoonia sp.]
MGVLIVILGAGPAVSKVSDSCVIAGQKAAARFAVPPAVLLAITQTETGRNDGGNIRPWPWTLNINGKGYWLDGRADALAMARAQIAAGRTSIDLGCFQINFRWHGQNFNSLDEMLDPDVSAAYAAQFLRKLYSETGNWSAAAGAYHSRSPAQAANYRKRFDRFYAVAAQNSQILASTRQRMNMFPLLQAGGGQTAMGSLVPMPEGAKR